MSNRTRPPTEDAEIARQERVERLRAIGVRIRARRDFLKLSQEQVTQKLNQIGFDIQRTSFAHYEHGVVEMPLITAIAVARILRTPLSSLVNDIDNDVEAKDTCADWLAALRRIYMALPANSRPLFARNVLANAEAQSSLIHDMFASTEEAA